LENLRLQGYLPLPRSEFRYFAPHLFDGYEAGKQFIQSSASSPAIMSGTSSPAKGEKGKQPANTSAGARENQTLAKGKLVVLNDDKGIGYAMGLVSHLRRQAQMMIELAPGFGGTLFENSRKDGYRGTYIFIEKSEFHVSFLKMFFEPGTDAEGKFIVHIHDVFDVSFINGLIAASEDPELAIIQSYATLPCLESEKKGLVVDTALEAIDRSDRLNIIADTLSAYHVFVQLHWAPPKEYEGLRTLMIDRGWNVVDVQVGGRSSFWVFTRAKEPTSVRDKGDKPLSGDGSSSPAKKSGGVSSSSQKKRQTILERIQKESMPSRISKTRRHYYLKEDVKKTLETEDDIKWLAEQFLDDDTVGIGDITAELLLEFDAASSFRVLREVIPKLAGLAYDRACLILERINLPEARALYQIISGGRQPIDFESLEGRTIMSETNESYSLHVVPRSPHEIFLVVRAPQPLPRMPEWKLSTGILGFSYGAMLDDRRAVGFMRLVVKDWDVRRKYDVIDTGVGDFTPVKGQGLFRALVEATMPLLPEGTIVLSTNIIMEGIRELIEQRQIPEEDWERNLFGHLIELRQGGGPLNEGPAIACVVGAFKYVPQGISYLREYAPHNGSLLPEGWRIADVALTRRVMNPDSHKWDLDSNQLAKIDSLGELKDAGIPRIVVIPETVFRDDVMRFYMAYGSTSYVGTEAEQEQRKEHEAMRYLEQVLEQPGYIARRFMKTPVPVLVLTDWQWQRVLDRSESWKRSWRTHMLTRLRYEKDYLERDYFRWAPLTPLKRLSSSPVDQGRRIPESLTAKNMTRHPRSEHVFTFGLILRALETNQKAQELGITPRRVQEILLDGRTLNAGLESDGDADVLRVIDKRLLGMNTLSEWNLVIHMKLVDPGIDIIGLDPQVKNDPENGYVQGVVQDMHEQFSDDEFDLIIIIRLFDPSYIDGLIMEGMETEERFYQETAKELRRVIKPQGVGLIDCHFGTSFNELAVTQLENAGFKVVPLWESGDYTSTGLFLIVNNKTQVKREQHPFPNSNSPATKSGASSPVGVNKGIWESGNLVLGYPGIRRSGMEIVPDILMSGSSSPGLPGNRMTIKSSSPAQAFPRDEGRGTQKASSPMKESDGVGAEWQVKQQLERQLEIIPGVILRLLISKPHFDEFVEAGWDEAQMSNLVQSGFFQHLPRSDALVTRKQLEELAKHPIFFALIDTSPYPFESQIDKRRVFMNPELLNLKKEGGSEPKANVVADAFFAAGFTRELTRIAAKRGDDEVFERVLDMIDRHIVIIHFVDGDIEFASFMVTWQLSIRFSLKADPRAALLTDMSQVEVIGQSIADDKKVLFRELEDTTPEQGTNEIELQGILEYRRQLAEKLGIDTRAYKLLDVAYIGYDLAEREVVNPDHQKRVGFYLGSWFDISNFLYSTDVPEAYFVDKRRIDADLLQKAFNDWDEITLDDDYAQIKRLGGFGKHGTLSEKNIVQELKAIGLKRDDIDSWESLKTNSIDSEGNVRISFPWIYPGTKTERIYTLVFVHASAAQLGDPSTTPAILNGVLAQGIGVYYQRAAEKIIVYYPAFAARIGSALQVGSCSVMDNYAISDWTIDPKPYLEGTGAIFSEPFQTDLMQHWEAAMLYCPWYYGGRRMRIYQKIGQQCLSPSSSPIHLRTNNELLTTNYIKNSSSPAQAVPGHKVTRSLVASQQDKIASSPVKRDNQLGSTSEDVLGYLRLALGNRAAGLTQEDAQRVIDAIGRGEDASILLKEILLGKAATVPTLESRSAAMIDSALKRIIVFLKQLEEFWEDKRRLEMIDFTTVESLVVLFHHVYYQEVAQEFEESILRRHIVALRHAIEKRYPDAPPYSLEDFKKLLLELTDHHNDLMDRIRGAPERFSEIFPDLLRSYVAYFANIYTLHNQELIQQGRDLWQRLSFAQIVRNPESVNPQDLAEFKEQQLGVKTRLLPQKPTAPLPQTQSGQSAAILGAGHAFDIHNSMPKQEGHFYLCDGSPTVNLVNQESLGLLGRKDIEARRLVYEELPDIEEPFDYIVAHRSIPRGPNLRMSLLKWAHASLKDIGQFQITSQSLDIRLLDRVEQDLRAAGFEVKTAAPLEPQDRWYLATKLPNALRMISSSPAHGSVMGARSPISSPAQAEGIGRQEREAQRHIEFRLSPLLYDPMTEEQAEALREELRVAVDIIGIENIRKNGISAVDFGRKLAEHFRIGLIDVTDAHDYETHKDLLNKAGIHSQDEWIQQLGSKGQLVSRNEKLPHGNLPRDWKRRLVDEGVYEAYMIVNPSPKARINPYLLMIHETTEYLVIRENGVNHCFFAAFRHANVFVLEQEINYALKLGLFEETFRARSRQSMWVSLHDAPDPIYDDFLLALRNCYHEFIARKQQASQHSRRDNGVRRNLSSRRRSPLTAAQRGSSPVRPKSSSPAQAITRDEGRRMRGDTKSSSAVGRVRSEAKPPRRGQSAIYTKTASSPSITSFDKLRTSLRASPAQASSPVGVNKGIWEFGYPGLGNQEIRRSEIGIVPDIPMSGSSSSRSPVTRMTITSSSPAQTVISYKQSVSSPATKESTHSATAGEQLKRFQYPPEQSRIFDSIEVAPELYEDRDRIITVIQIIINEMFIEDSEEQRTLIRSLQELEIKAEASPYHIRNTIYLIPNTGPSSDIAHEFGHHIAKVLNIRVPYNTLGSLIEVLFRVLVEGEPINDKQWDKGKNIALDYLKGDIGEPELKFDIVSTWEDGSTARYVDRIRQESNISTNTAMEEYTTADRLVGLFFTLSQQDARRTIQLMFHSIRSEWYPTTRIFYFNKVFDYIMLMFLGFCIVPTIVGFIVGFKFQSFLLGIVAALVVGFGMFFGFNKRLERQIKKGDEKDFGPPIEGIKRKGTSSSPVQAITGHKVTRTQVTSNKNKIISSPIERWEQELERLRRIFQAISTHGILGPETAEELRVDITPSGVELPPLGEESFNSRVLLITYRVNVDLEKLTGTLFDVGTTREGKHVWSDRKVSDKTIKGLIDHTLLFMGYLDDIQPVYVKSSLFNDRNPFMVRSGLLPQLEEIGRYFPNLPFSLASRILKLREVEVLGAISPAAIKYILTPRREFAELLKETSINAAYHPEITHVEREKLYPSDGFRQARQVADYEGEMQAIQERHPDKVLWVHIMRLPLTEEIIYQRADATSSPVETSDSGQEGGERILSFRDHFQQVHELMMSFSTSLEEGKTANMILSDLQEDDLDKLKEGANSFIEMSYFFKDSSIESSYLHSAIIPRTIKTINLIENILRNYSDGELSFVSTLNDLKQRLENFLEYAYSEWDKLREGEDLRLQGSITISLETFHLHVGYRDGHICVHQEDINIDFRLPLASNINVSRAIHTIANHLREALEATGTIKEAFQRMFNTNIVKKETEKALSSMQSSSPTTASSPVLRSARSGRRSSSKTSSPAQAAARDERRRMKDECVSPETVSNPIGKVGGFAFGASSPLSDEERFFVFAFIWGVLAGVAGFLISQWFESLPLDSPLRYSVSMLVAALCLHSMFCCGFPLGFQLFLEKWRIGKVSRMSLDQGLREQLEYDLVMGLSWDKVKVAKRLQRAPRLWFGIGFCGVMVMVFGILFSIIPAEDEMRVFKYWGMAAVGGGLSIFAYAYYRLRRIRIIVDIFFDRLPKPYLSPDITLLDVLKSAKAARDDTEDTSSSPLALTRSRKMGTAPFSEVSNYFGASSPVGKPNALARILNFKLYSQLHHKEEREGVKSVLVEVYRDAFRSEGVIIDAWLVRSCLGEMETLVGSGHYDILVVYTHNQPIGVFQFYLPGQDRETKKIRGNGIFIAEGGYRRRGIGSLLRDGLIIYLSNNGFQVLLTDEILRDNIASQAFHAELTGRNDVVITYHGGKDVKSGPIQSVTYMLDIYSPSGIARQVFSRSNIRPSSSPAIEYGEASSSLAKARSSSPVEKKMPVPFSPMSNFTAWVRLQHSDVLPDLRIFTWRQSVKVLAGILRQRLLYLQEMLEGGFQEDDIEDFGVRVEFVVKQLFPVTDQLYALLKTHPVVSRQHALMHATGERINFIYINLYAVYRSIQKGGDDPEAKRFRKEHFDWAHWTVGSFLDFLPTLERRWLESSPEIDQANPASAASSPVEGNNKDRYSLANVRQRLDRVGKLVLEPTPDYKQMIRVLFERLGSVFELSDEEIAALQRVQREFDSWETERFSPQAIHKVFSELHLDTRQLTRRPDSKIKDTEDFIILLGAIFQEGEAAPLARPFVENIIEGFFDEELKNSITFPPASQFYHMRGDRSIAAWPMSLLYVTPESLLLKAPRHYGEKQLSESDDKETKAKIFEALREIDNWREKKLREEGVISCLKNLFRKVRAALVYLNLLSRRNEGSAELIGFIKEIPPLKGWVTAVEVDSPSPVLFFDPLNCTIRPMGVGRSRLVLYSPRLFPRTFDINNPEDMKELATFILNRVEWCYIYYTLKQKGVDLGEIHRILDEHSANFTKVDRYGLVSLEAIRNRLSNLAREYLVAEAASLIPHLIHLYREVSCRIDNLERDYPGVYDPDIFVGSARSSLYQIEEELKTLGMYFEIIGEAEISRELFDKRDVFIKLIQKNDEGMIPAALQWELVEIHWREGDIMGGLDNLEIFLTGRNFPMVGTLDLEAREAALDYIRNTVKPQVIRGEISRVIGSLRFFFAEDESRIRDLEGARVEAMKLIDEFERDSRVPPASSSPIIDEVSKLRAGDPSPPPSYRASRGSSNPLHFRTISNLQSPISTKKSSSPSTLVRLALRARSPSLRASPAQSDQRLREERVADTQKQTPKPRIGIVQPIT
ncbi:GNAT family N-acetyltransferase, partial [Candidatus Omnitrophota bacterium]